MIRKRGREAGFTLVEMLVSLMIFGILAAGGVTLMSFSVRAQEVADRQLSTLGTIRRTGALLTADLAQAQPRPWRDGTGRAQPAFLGGSGRDALLLVLVRSGWDNPDQLPRPSVQRVEYRLAGGRLYRIGLTNVDGNSASNVAPLLEDVRTLQLRYRDAQGSWRDAWQPGDPRERPAAVEMIVSTGRLPPIRQLFLVGAAQ